MAKDDGFKLNGEAVESRIVKLSALSIVTKLYQANATKNSGSKLTLMDMTVGDLVEHSQYIESYLKGDI